MDLSACAWRRHDMKDGAGRFERRCDRIVMARSLSAPFAARQSARLDHSVTVSGPIA